MWRAPRIGVLKVNLDASIKEGLVAWVEWDNTEYMTNIGAKRLNKSPMVVAEAIGVFEGVRLARRHGRTKMLVKGDNH